MTKHLRFHNLQVKVYSETYLDYFYDEIKRMHARKADNLQMFFFHIYFHHSSYI